MLKKILIGILFILLGLTLFFYVERPAFTNSGVPTYKLEFDSKEWKAGSQRTKGAMISSLINSDTLAGMRAVSIRKLLGEPDQELESGYIYKVDIGHSMSPAGDPWLYDFIIRFDSSGFAKETFLTD